jgi:stage II sporulation protein D
MTCLPRIATASAAATAALCALAPAAGAADKLVITGAGFGHGVGMSQYGALGMAQQGWTHRQILGHYYSGTQVGVIDPNRPVRVLLGGAAGVTRFTGASAAAGRTLSPAAAYGARRTADGRVELLSAKGRRIAVAAAPLRVTGPGPIALAGRGAYRGSVELHPGGYGLDVINVVGVEDYVRGVVARESPASWPAAALQAQAVAARTYALTTAKGVSSAWEHYADTRSQVYGGVAAETPSTDAAVAATRGEVVTYEGRPVVTYFFSTSGGRTEDVENSLGGTPQPWLKAVDDPYDRVSPRHRWAPQTLTLAQAGAKLRGYVKGSLVGIRVVKRGRSPRIVSADVIGTAGKTRISGATLRYRFGLYDTWAYFKSLTADPVAPAPPLTAPANRLDATGGAGPSRLLAPAAVADIAGRAIPAGRGALVRVERRSGSRWVAHTTGQVGRDGAYRVGVQATGEFRVSVGGVAIAVRVSGR